MKVLIVEDEEILACNIQLFLEHEEIDGAHFEVERAENGVRAMAKLHDEYDLIILDVKMPRASGIQVIEWLNERRPHKRPPVILITAYPGIYEVARLAIKMGVQKLLRKPFELSELLDDIREIVQVRRQLPGATKDYRILPYYWTLAFGETETAFIQANGRLNFAEILPLRWKPADILGVKTCQRSF
jgi:DNA-binding response OmpR family regulator